MITSILTASRRCAGTTSSRCVHLGRQAGAFAIEFSIVALLFLTMIFTIMEVSRALYLWNALQEVTRRAARDAAVTDFRDAGAIESLRQRAIFRNSPGMLLLGNPVSDQHIRIDYLSLQNDTNQALRYEVMSPGSLPGCPTRNKITCTGKSGDANCIRLVRVRICQPGGADCGAVPYQSMVPFVNFRMNLPVSATIVRAQSLGYVPGMASCN